MQTTNPFDPYFGRDKTPPIAVKFFIDHEIDVPASHAAGREIYRDVERVELQIYRRDVAVGGGAGGQRLVYNVNDSHRGRWPDEYRAFLARQATAGEPGKTPIEDWAALTPAQVAGLRQYELRTVEDVAQVSDEAMMAISVFVRAGAQLRDRARAFLDGAARDQLVARLIAENAVLQREKAELERQVAGLTKANETLALRCGLQAPIDDLPIGDYSQHAQLDIEAKRSALDAIAALPLRSRPALSPPAPSPAVAEAVITEEP